MNKMLYIIIAIQVISTLWIISTVEKHSIHPIYGQKIENVNYKCTPWDSC